MKHCLWYNQKDPTVKELKIRFEEKLVNLLDIQEQKDVMSAPMVWYWDDNLINPERVVVGQTTLKISIPTGIKSIQEI